MRTNGLSFASVERMQERKVGSVVLSKDPAIFSNSVDAILYVSLSDSFVIKVSTFSFSFCAIFLSSGGCGAANGGRVVALLTVVGWWRWWYSWQHCQWWWFGWVFSFSVW